MPVAAQAPTPQLVLCGTKSSSMEPSQSSSRPLQLESSRAVGTHFDPVTTQSDGSEVGDDDGCEQVSVRRTALAKSPNWMLQEPAVSVSKQSLPLQALLTRTTLKSGSAPDATEQLDAKPKSSTDCGQVLRFVLLQEKSRVSVITPLASSVRHRA